MGFSNMMSLVGGGGTPGVSDPSMEHGGGMPDPVHEHRDMNFGDRLLGVAESRIPGAGAFMPQVPQQPDLIGMNAKPSSGGGLSMLLKLIGI